MPRRSSLAVAASDTTTTGIVSATATPARLDRSDARALADAPTGEQRDGYQREVDEQ